MRRKITNAEKYEYEDYMKVCNQIRSATAPLVITENENEKAKRKEALQKDFFKFCKYYFKNFITSEFGWFHKKAAKEMLADPNCFMIAEWAREHAKSVFFDIFMPMFLYAKGDVSGMMIASANNTKAQILLGDIRAQFDSNALWINDYGELAAPGEWRAEYFATTDNCGFWAFGRGQSPRGVRKSEKRPNYAVVDDIDDKVLVKNLERVNETVDWILEDFYGAMPIKGARMVIAGNRIHNRSVLAHMVGDLEPTDPKRAEIVHIKVFALENPKTHKKDKNGTPAWKENYTKAHIQARIAKIGTRAGNREYFHEHSKEGTVFLNKWFQWKLPPRRFDEIITYGDPSWKNTKNSDYKAVVTVGKLGREFYILKAWVRRASINSMVNIFYDRFDDFEMHSRYYIEANMNQDLLVDDEFPDVGDERGKQIPIRYDKRKKPDKVTRIEGLTPFFEKGYVWFNSKERKDPDMQRLLDQLKGFPFDNDDGPDAMEGAIYKLQVGWRGGKFPPRTGKFKRSKSRQ